MKLDKELIEEAVTVLSERSGILLTVEQMKDLLKGHNDLKVVMDEYGAQDTDVAGQLLSLLSLKLLRRKWPMNKESIDMNEFSSRLQNEAVNAGYRILKNN